MARAAMVQARVAGYEGDMQIFTYIKLLFYTVKLIARPSRLENAIAVADLLTKNPRALADIVEALRATPHGEPALRDRPRVTPFDLAALRRLAPGTLGRELVDHADRAGIDLGALPVRAAIDDASYVDAHLYETHDIWHVVTGIDNSVAGELGLLAFYLAQLPSRLGLVLIASGLVQTWLSAFDERDARMRAIVRGWLLGRRAASLLGVDWSRSWDVPVAELRARHRIDIAAIDAVLDIAPRARGVAA
jgi:ubiquinone biosynthesis protein COQ4